MRTVLRSGKHLFEMDQMSVNQIELILQHSQEPDEEKIEIKDSLKESLMLQLLIVQTTETSFTKYKILQKILQDSQVPLPFLPAQNLLFCIRWSLEQDA